MIAPSFLDQFPSERRLAAAIGADDQNVRTLSCSTKRGGRPASVCQTHDAPAHPLLLARMIGPHLSKDLLDVVLAFAEQRVIRSSS